MNRASWLCAPGEMPVALEEVAYVDTERLLEDWIEADPSMLGGGLIVVGRQVQFHSGPADLLAIDPQGRWVVIEIKRDRSARQDVAQAFDYASSLAIEPNDSLRVKLASGLNGKPYRDTALGAIDAALSEEGPLPREVACLVTGVGLHDSVARMQSFLAHRGMDVRVVTFEAHRASDGRLVLSRDIQDETSSDSAVGSASETEPWETGIDRIRSMAEHQGVLPQFDSWLNASRVAGLTVRPYKHAIMIAPPTHKNAFLMVGRPAKDGGLRFNHGPREFAQWFPWISSDSVEAALGPSARGMGNVYQGAELDDYVDRVQAFLSGAFPPPPEFESFMEQQHWNPERFIAAFSSRPELQAKVLRLFAESNATYGAGAVGQAHLIFDDGGQQILQITTAGKLRGMWSLGAHDSHDPAWNPLKDLLSTWGGLGVNGEAPAIDFEDLTMEDIDSVVAQARATSRRLLGLDGENA